MSDDSREFRRRALLCVQRALWEKVTPGLRAVAIGVDVRLLRARFLYDHEPTEFERELVDIAETELHADFASSGPIDIAFTAVMDTAPGVRLQEGESWFAYLRHEGSATHPERTVVERAVIAGLGDLVAASELRTIVEQSPGRPLAGDTTTSVLGALAHLVLAGYAVLGEVSDGGFQAWDDADGGLARAGTALLGAADDSAAGPEPFWLQATATGLQVADGVLEREAAADAASAALWTSSE